MNDIFIVPLTNSSKICLIDAEDAERVLKHTWHLCTTTGYIRSGRKYLRHRFLHRYILLDTTKYAPVVHHKFDRRFDNRRSQLVATNCSTNEHNKKKEIGVFTSNFKGVYLNRKYQKWKSGLFYKGRFKHLGTFDTEIQAAKAYNDEAIKIYGVNANLNCV